MKIYGDRRSGICYKIQLVCALLDIKHEWINIDILNGETKSAEFLSRNPNGKIPLLELDDGKFIVESNAIVNYLAYNWHQTKQHHCLCVQVYACLNDLLRFELGLADFSKLHFV